MKWRIWKNLLLYNISEEAEEKDCISLTEEFITQHMYLETLRVA